MELSGRGTNKRKMYASSGDKTFNQAEDEARQQDWNDDDAGDTEDFI